MIFVLLYAFTINERYNGLAEYGAGQIGYFVMETVSLLYYSGDRTSPFGILTEPIFFRGVRNPFYPFDWQHIEGQKIISVESGNWCRGWEPNRDNWAL